jgi:hypothetical protein
MRSKVMLILFAIGLTHVDVYGQGVLTSKTTVKGRNIERAVCIG